MKSILAIDPGTDKSGFLVWNGRAVEHGTPSNTELLARVMANDFGPVELCGIEMVASYGMPVGKEVFETVYWIGRFYEQAHRHFTTIRVFRKDIKLLLCGTARAKDANVRQALIDVYGPPGTKKSPGATYGVSGHIWSCLAIAHHLSV